MAKSKQSENFSESTIVLSLIVLVAVIAIGFYMWGSEDVPAPSGEVGVVKDLCPFPAAATDLRSAGLQLSKEISGTVGYSPEGFLTVESSNGFVMLTPITEATHIDDLIRDQITQALGCEGTTDLAYWVFEVSDPAQLPPEIVRELGGDQPNQILLILGSLYVYSVDSLTLDAGAVDEAVNDIVRSRSSQGGGSTGGGTSGGTGGSSGGTTGGAPIRSRTNVTGNSVFTPEGSTPIAFGGPNPSSLDTLYPQTGSLPNNGGGSNGGNTGGGGGGSSGGGSNNCELFCEDPITGDRFEPGRSGCQGADFYDQNPEPPQGTRQVLWCEEEGQSCPDEYWFYWRNCSADLGSRQVPGTANFDISGIPTSPGSPGTLFTVDPTIPGSTSRTIRCSYPDQTKAIQCGMPGSGEYCLPGYSPQGCVAPPPDF